MGDVWDVPGTSFDRWGEETSSFSTRDCRIEGDPKVPEVNRVVDSENSLPKTRPGNLPTVTSGSSIPEYSPFSSTGGF